ncbi:RNA polymerase sigma-54 factor [Rubricella aquisinus]|uniref:RNA polymerase sigma-54 factor n=1 Tax=Rubricella aquisinus TaxID=2028108 RepID=A0A840WL66_9RHOB|nr:RNA polymerase factor sigma-54 [Rubricella aquisinus]MBB5514392.1 RNA polymerase sigma-54 factor [Rubricella aquisinus]
MALSPRLEQRQQQKLVMTPQLQQAIRLLQMNNLELAAHLNEELQRNPLLDVQEGMGDSAGQARETIARGVDTQISADNPTVAEAVFETGRENLYDEAPADRAARMGADLSLNGAPLDAETPLSRPETLRESLLSQIGMEAHLADDVRLAAAALVDELDGRGYLDAPLFEIADRYGMSVPKLEEALTALQACEPAGIGARDLAECLTLQLKDRGLFDPAFALLLQHLPLVASGKRDVLAKVVEVSDARLARMIATLRDLDPKPGATLSLDPVVQAVPDVFILPGADDGWRVELNTDTLPRVLVNEKYAADLSAKGEEVASFITECTAGANWLIRAMEQRANTILKITSRIVAHQDAFFREGVAALRPLTMQTVADEIGMHESTVSRVANGKFLHCPRGTFELRFFFGQAVGGQGDDAEAHAAKAIQTRISKLIDAEDPAKTLSDDKIAEILKADGMNVARRTVAKYREGMGILSSVQRRRQKSGK